MATLIETLVQTLNEECDVFDQLIKVSNEKTQVIVANDIVKLQKITDQEQNVLTKIANLEHEREIASNDIVTVLGKETKDVTLKKIISYMSDQPELQNQLAKVHDRLIIKVKRLDQMNQHNAILVNDQLDMIQFDLNVIQGIQQAPETGSYTKSAYNSGESYAPDKSYFDSKS